LFFIKEWAVAFVYFIYVLTGFMVWMFARYSYIVGASGVVYGLAGFVLSAGIFRKNIKSIVLSLVILTVILPCSQVFYRRMCGNVSPGKAIFSDSGWNIYSLLIKNVKEDDEVEQPDPWQNEGKQVLIFQRIF
jgi:uncharacterized protein with PQ loop repeat